MPKIAERMKLLGTETAFGTMARANELGVEDRFEIGETGFETPGFIIDEIVGALRRGRTHYGPSAGDPRVREAAADYFSETRGVTVKPDRVIITPGAKPIIAFGMMACVNRGDEVVGPDPGYSIYRSMAEFCEARWVPWPLRMSNGFVPDPADLTRLITRRTKMVVVNMPHNPTGSSMGRKVMEGIFRAMRRVGYRGYIMSDEVYRDFVYDDDPDLQPCSFLSYPSLASRLIVVDGVSKSKAMTGVRGGYGYAPLPVARQMAQLATNFYSCTPVAIQDGIWAALTGSTDFLAERLETLRGRRDLMVDLLSADGRVRCPKPPCAFYVYPDFSNLTNSTSRLAKLVLEDGRVALLSGTCFGSKKHGAERHVRLCFSTNDEDKIRRGLGNLARFLAMRDYFEFDLRKKDPVLV